MAELGICWWRHESRNDKWHAVRHEVTVDAGELGASSGTTVAARGPRWAFGARTRPCGPVGVGWLAALCGD